MIGRAARFGVHKRPDELEGCGCPGTNFRIKLDVINLRETNSPEQQMKNHSLIVEGVLKTSAIRPDLIEHCFPQERRTLLVPSDRIFQFRIKRPGSPQTD